MNEIECAPPPSAYGENILTSELHSLPTVALHHQKAIGFSGITLDLQQPNWRIGPAVTSVRDLKAQNVGLLRSDS